MTREIYQYRLEGTEVGCGTQQKEKRKEQQER
jgi:hypothetical protein